MLMPALNDGDWSRAMACPPPRVHFPLVVVLAGVLGRWGWTHFSSSRRSHQHQNVFVLFRDGNVVRYHDINTRLELHKRKVIDI